MVRYTPDTGRTGLDSFTFQASDGQEYSTLAAIEVRVFEMPMANAGGPYSIAEGQDLTLDASGSTAPNGAPLTYAWDINEDNVFGEITGTQPSLTWEQLTALGVNDGAQPPITRTVTVEVTDPYSFARAIADLLIANVAPQVEAGPNQSVSEGDIVSLTAASFTDPSPVDTHTATIDWGDGTAPGAGTVTQGAGNGNVGGSHVYATEDEYTVTVCVTDDDAGSACDTLLVEVSNVAPTVEAGPDVTVDKGSTFELVPATFRDQGTLDTHTATINWGDGSSLEAGSVSETPTGPPGSIDGVAGAVAFPAHTYTNNGIFVATIEVCDNAAICTTDTVQVTVENEAASVEAGSNRTVDEGTALQLEPSSFSDLSMLDTHTATIDWGDGSAPDSGTVADGTVTFPVHVYADNGEYTTTVCVIDNSDASGCDDLTVAVSNVAPTAEVGSDIAADEGTALELAPAAFRDQGTLDTHTATIDWGDGSTLAGTVTEAPTGPPGSTDGAAGSVALPSHVYADNGEYTVKVCVTDDDGGIGCDELTVSVSNVAATVEAGSDVTVAEGAILELTPAAFSDPGTLDTHTATINWGDGSALDAGTGTEAPTSPPGSTDGAAGTVGFPTHIYADNGTYTVTVCITDDDEAGTCDQLTVTVSNVAPTVEAGPDSAVAKGAVLELAPATFSDQGTLDTHTATINWGDRSTLDAGSVTKTPTGPPGSIDGTVGFPTHVYADDGSYNVTVCVTDDDEAVTCDELTVTVSNVPPIDEKPETEPVFKVFYPIIQQDQSDQAFHPETHSVDQAQSAVRKRRQ